MTLRLAKDVPSKAGQQFFAAHACRLFDQRAMLGRQRPLEVDPFMNADRRHLEDAC